VTWEPISRADLTTLLSRELATTPPQDRAVYERYRVEPEVVYRVFSRDPSSPAPTFVVARADAAVLFYDDIEEEWGTANVGRDGRINDWGTWGEELRRALRNFPVPAALRSTE
jgi:hypothetical protein